MRLIQSITVGPSNVSNIIFSNIPQNFTDLVVLISGRSTATTGNQTSNTTVIGLYPNNAGYPDVSTAFRTLFGNGSAAGSTSETGQYVLGGYVPNSNATANIFGSTKIEIVNYSGTTQKVYTSQSVAESNSSAATQVLVSATDTQTPAVTSISMDTAGGSWLSGSTAYLYGITRGSDGITTVS
jgi:hypothetical protein